MSDTPVSAELPPGDIPDEAMSIDVSKAMTRYVNFCRVTGTPEELIIDFALNSEVYGTQEYHLQADQRVAVGFFTAKRLLYALQMAVQRHEAAFGVIETSVERRVIQSSTHPR